MARPQFLIQVLRESLYGFWANSTGANNGTRVRAWRWELLRQLVDAFAIRVTVYHYSVTV